MMRRIKSWWLIWLIGGLLGLYSQIVWLTANHWEDPALRIIAGLIFGALLLGGLAFGLAFVFKRLGRLDLGGVLAAVNIRAAEIVISLSGLNTLAGRRAWLTCLGLLILGTGVFAYRWCYIPYQGGKMVKEFFLAHEDNASKGLALFHYPDLGRARPPKHLGATTRTSYKIPQEFPGGRQTGFEMRLMGVINPPEDAVYGIGGWVDDGFMILIDGEPVISDWRHGPPRERWARVSLNKGPHALEVRYFQAGGMARLKLYWQPPGKDRLPLGQAPLTPLKSDTPLARLAGLELEYKLVPEKRGIYPPFGEGRHWHLPWW